MRQYKKKTDYNRNCCVLRMLLYIRVCRRPNVEQLIRMTETEMVISVIISISLRWNDYQYTGLSVSSFDISLESAQFGSDKLLTHSRKTCVCVCVCDFACRHCTVWLSFSHFCSTDVNRLNLHRLPTWRNILNMYDSGKRITRTPLHTSYINQNSISLFEPHVRAYDYDHGFFFHFSLKITKQSIIWMHFWRHSTRLLYSLKRTAFLVKMIRKFSVCTMYTLSNFHSMKTNLITAICWLYTSTVRDTWMGTLLKSR